MTNEIPTKVISIGDGELKKEITVRQWLTQEQEDNLNAIIVGDQKISVSNEESGSIAMQVGPEQMAAYNKLLIESFCVDFGFEQYNIMRPSLRRYLQSSGRSSADIKTWLNLK